MPLLQLGDRDLVCLRLVGECDRSGRLWLFARQCCDHAVKAGIDGRVQYPESGLAELYFIQADLHGVRTRAGSDLGS